jgi:L-alanine-DL-glutamate epimerase-like enolase superfamily enzyme
MKITAIETFVVDAGWRPWQFTAVRTDEGITGYGEMSDGRNPFGIIGTIADFFPILEGKDPLAVEARYWDMYRMARQSPGGIAAKAISGVELALWDVKAKTLGVPVYELFGGPVRQSQQVYWSHCGTSRVRNNELIGVQPLRSFQAVTELGAEVREKGFKALKTNINFPGDPAQSYVGGFGGGGSTDQNVSVETLNHIEKYIAAFEEGTKGVVQIALDLNFHFKPLAARQICNVMEQFNTMWVEVDMYEPAGLAEVKAATSVPITSGENLFGIRDYRPYFQSRAMDNVMIDVPWNGFARSRDAAMLAESYELNIAPHNYYSHLSTMHSINLCATVPNVRIMEADIDDVPWKDELTGGALDYTGGELQIPAKSGWGVDFDEDVAKAHEWQAGRGPGYRD